MTINEILEKYHLSMAELSRRYNVPIRTIQDWKCGKRKAPEYVIVLIEKCLGYEENDNKNG